MTGEFIEFSIRLIRPASTCRITVHNKRGLAIFFNDHHIQQTIAKDSLRGNSKVIPELIAVGYTKKKCFGTELQFIGIYPERVKAFALKKWRVVSEA